MAKTVNVSPSALLSQSFHGLQIKNSMYLDSTCESEILEIHRFFKAPGIDVSTDKVN